MLSGWVAHSSPADGNKNFFPPKRISWTYPPSQQWCSGQGIISMVVLVLVSLIIYANKKNPHFVHRLHLAKLLPGLSHI